MIFKDRFELGGQGGAGGVQETGEERTGSEISTVAESGREIQKAKLSLFVTAHHPVKETNPTTLHLNI